jgi:hypothetical protein
MEMPKEQRPKQPCPQCQARGRWLFLAAAGGVTREAYSQWIDCPLCQGESTIPAFRLGD